MSKRFKKLKAELERAFSAPESSYILLTADEVIARNRVVAPKKRREKSDDQALVEIVKSRAEEKGVPVNLKDL